MSTKRGLPDNLDLGAMLLNRCTDSTPVPENNPAPSAASVEPVQPEPRTTTTRKPKLEVQYSKKQRGLSISEPVMLRLKLESLRSGRTQSEIAEEILCKYLPNLKIAS